MDSPLDWVLGDMVRPEGRGGSDVWVWWWGVALAISR